jgi:hypothetical protein
MVIKADSPGTIVVDAASATGYKNDGKGTPVAVSHTPLTFSIGAAVPGASVRNQWTELVGRDTTPPEPFSLSLGSDPSVFDGKTFVSFQTTDAQSGVAYYEVKEGERAPVRTESPYVLYEQTKPVRVTVYAYDASGNVQTATYTPTSGTSYLYWIIGALLLLIILGVWRWYRKTL